MSDAVVYLDHAAATPVADEVLRAMQPYFADKFYNPSATYLVAKQVRHDVETARKQVAACLGSRPAEVVFTAGGSEANNLAINGVMRRYPDANLVVSAIEHESVLEAAAQYHVKVAKPQADGILKVDTLASLIDDKTVLVSLMYANNEIGTVQPIRELATAVAAIRSVRREAGNKLPLFIHTDAAQAANYLDLHVSRLGVDLMTLNGGKIYGPKQSGVLYVRAGVMLEPLIRGGGQERGLRSGTENVAGVIGFATALEQAQAKRHDEAKRLHQLQRLFLDEVKAKLPSAVVNGSASKRLPNNVHLTCPGVDNERLLIQLEEQGILAAAGSACSASDDQPSHVLQALGLSDAEARSSVRFAMGRVTTESDIRHVVDTLAQLLA